jgi:hypothetical protein
VDRPVVGVALDGDRVLALLAMIAPMRSSVGYAPGWMHGAARAEDELVGEQPHLTGRARTRSWRPCRQVRVLDERVDLRLSAWKDSSSLAASSAALAAAASSVRRLGVVAAHRHVDAWAGEIEDSGGVGEAFSARSWCRAPSSPDRR